MDQTQNGEAMTPNRGPMSMAEIVGGMFQAFVSHGVNMEEHLMEAQQGARNLGVQLRMAHRAIDERLERIGELQDTVKARDELLYEMWAMLCNSMPDATLPLHDHDGWAQRRAELRDLYHATLPAQTDAEPKTDDGRGRLPKQRQTEGMPMPVDTGVDVVYDHEDALRLKDDYVGACQQIAAMHAAAFGGEVRGPERGVVEDIQDLYNRCQAAEEALSNCLGGVNCKCPAEECGKPHCGHAPDGGNHPAAPSAG